MGTFLMIVLEVGAALGAILTPFALYAIAKEIRLKRLF
jgi:hypothetical protein